MVYSLLKGMTINFDQGVFVNSYLESNEGFTDAHFSKYK